MQINVAHRCLGIPEIQTAILTTLTPTDCAKLARTCTWLHAQAVDVVWQDLPTLALLVRCMSSDLIVETSNTIALIVSLPISTSAEYSSLTSFKHARASAVSQQKQTGSCSTSILAGSSALPKRLAFFLESYITTIQRVLRIYPPIIDSTTELCVQ